MTKKIIPTEIVEINDDSSSDISSDSGKSDKSVNSEKLMDLSHPHITKEEIEKILGRKIKDPFYYQRAFIHKSVKGMVKKALNRGEHVCEYMKENNETLEFLGDKVFSMAVTDYLFDKYSHKKAEGFLTKARTRIEKGTTMSEIAIKMGFKDKVVASNYVFKSANNECNKRLLEDAFEAFIGAMRLEFGLMEAYNFSLEIIKKYITEEKILKDDNYKDLLVRYTQFKKWDPPEFVVVEETGPSHKKQFTIEARIYGKSYGSGIAAKKKIAEQLASEKAVSFLNITEESMLGPRE